MEKNARFPAVRITGGKLANRPAPTAPGLQVGDRYVDTTAGTVATLIVNALGVPVWAETAPPVVPGSWYLAEAGGNALQGFGKVTIPNANVTGASAITAGGQSGGTYPQVGALFCSVKTPGVSFTIESTAGAPDTGVFIYWQRWEQNP